MARKKLEAPFKVQSFVPCAHDDCDFPSVCSVKIGLASAALCMKHYVAHFQKKADAFCEANLLDKHADEEHHEWRARLKKFCKEKSEKFKRRNATWTS